MTARPVNDDNIDASGAKIAASTDLGSRLVEMVQAIVSERLARDPQRPERILAEAEAEAWSEVKAMLKDSMKAVIVHNLSTPSTTTAPSASEDFTGPHAPTSVAMSGSGIATSELTPLNGVLNAVPTGAVPDDSPHTTISTETHPPTDIDVAPVLAEASKETRDNGTGIYVYGVIERGAAELPTIVGIADESLVRLHEYGRLAAVVSEVPLSEFGQAAIEAQLNDLVWLEKSVRRHQAVLDKMLALATLAPMKFATIFLDAARLESWLDEQQVHLLALLAGLRNRQEWGLKLLVDRKVLAEHVAMYSESVRTLQAQMNGKSQGTAYFLLRRIQEVTAEEVERVSFAVADIVHERLARLSVAACINPLPSEDVEPDVKMLLNGAYLVADADVPAIQSTVDELVAEHGDNGFQFQLSGPWPAYNFVAMAPELVMADDGNRRAQ